MIGTEPSENRLLGLDCLDAGGLQPRWGGGGGPAATGRWEQAMAAEQLLGQTNLILEWGSPGCWLREGGRGEFCSLQ